MSNKHSYKLEKSLSVVGCGIDNKTEFSLGAQSITLVFDKSDVTGEDIISIETSGKGYNFDDKEELISFANTINEALFDLEERDRKKKESEIVKVVYTGLNGTLQTGYIYEACILEDGKVAEVYFKNHYDFYDKQKTTSFVIIKGESAY